MGHSRSVAEGGKMKSLKLSWETVDGFFVYPSFGGWFIAVAIFVVGPKDQSPVLLGVDWESEGLFLTRGGSLTYWLEN